MSQGPLTINGCNYDPSAENVLVKRETWGMFSMLVVGSPSAFLAWT